jgi:diguanylate cyclase (GGDEF)-like protein/PAS domain S-box-containing protein
MSLLVEGAPLATVLESLIQEIELDYPFAHCSVLLLDQSGKHLTTGAAPSLPDFYTKEIDGVEIGDGVGSCGTSAFTQKRVIVDNIQTHPFWEGYKELAAKAGLGSCWSEPIIGSGGKLLGTFAIYHEHPIAPSEGDLKFIEFSSQLAAVAIEQSHLRHEQRLSSRIFNSTREGIMVTDSKGVMIDVNQAFTDITGYSRDEAIGKNPSILNSGKQDAEFYEHLWHTLGTYGYWQGELWNRAKDGTLYAEQLSISTLKDESNAVVNYVGIFSDITTSKQQQEKLKLMAHYDQLTKLPNRTLFNDRFNQAAAHSKRNGTHLAVVFIDLDNFKPVNDNLGHEVGDLLLIEVAERIKAAIREEDTVSRQGGDEFVILLNDMKFIPQSEELTRRIHESLSQPFYIGNHTVNISASSGIALYPRDDIDLDILIRYADQAMYQAKRTGKNRTQIFDKKNG